MNNDKYNHTNLKAFKLFTNIVSILVWTQIVENPSLYTLRPMARTFQPNTMHDDGIKPSEPIVLFAVFDAKMVWMSD